MNVIKEEGEEILKSNKRTSRMQARKLQKLKWEKKNSDFILDSAARVGQKSALV